MNMNDISKRKRLGGQKKVKGLHDLRKGGYFGNGRIVTENWNWRRKEQGLELSRGASVEKGEPGKKGLRKTVDSLTGSGGGRRRALGEKWKGYVDVIPAIWSEKVGVRTFGRKSAAIEQSPEVVDEKGNPS